MIRRAPGVTPLLLALAACETVLPPLRGEIDVGRDAYAVFVGGGDRDSDLYALGAARGIVMPITYTAVAELAPALSPDGVAVAFLRAASLADSMPGTVWVLNLRSGGERELALPKGAGKPRRVGWARDGTGIFVAADAGVYRFAAPPARAEPRLVAGRERAVAESSFAVLLGNPVFARVIGCENGRALCVVGDTGAPEVLARDARDPVRWGDDSVAYFTATAWLVVRPLGPGRRRRVDWTAPPARPRAMTFFPGRRPTTPPRTPP